MCQKRLRLSPKVDECKPLPRACAQFAACSRAERQGQTISLAKS